MKHISLQRFSFLLCFAAFLMMSSLNAAILLVTPNGRGEAVIPNGSVSGNSWNTQSFNSLQSALNRAQNGDEIWIKEGVYSQKGKYTINNSVAIYGGFRGNETSRPDRITSKSTFHQTDGNYAIKNCVFDIMVPNVTLQNLVIKGGRSLNDGAGVVVKGHSSVIRNCIITENISRAHKGGGICYNSPTEGRHILSDCVIVNNQVGKLGGGIYVSAIDAVNFLAERSLFATNRLTVNEDLKIIGVAICVERPKTSKALFTSLVIVNNGSSSSAKACAAVSCDQEDMAAQESIVFRNCTIASNMLGKEPTRTAAQFVRLENCVLWRNGPGQTQGYYVAVKNCAYKSLHTPKLLGDNMTISHNSNDALKFIRPTAQGFKSYNSSSDWQLAPGSVLIGKGAKLDGYTNQTLDFNGNPLLHDGKVDIGACAFTGNNSVAQKSSSATPSVNTSSSSPELNNAPVETENPYLKVDKRIHVGRILRAEISTTRPSAQDFPVYRGQYERVDRLAKFDGIVTVSDIQRPAYVALTICLDNWRSLTLYDFQLVSGAKRYRAVTILENTGLSQLDKRNMVGERFLGNSQSVFTIYFIVDCPSGSANERYVLDWILQPDEKTPLEFINLGNKAFTAPTFLLKHRADYMRSSDAKNKPVLDISFNETIPGLGLLNGAQMVANGISGNFLNLASENAYVKYTGGNDFPIKGNLGYTVSFWIQLPNTVGDQVLFSIGSPFAENSILLKTTSTKLLAVACGPQESSSPTNCMAFSLSRITDRKWHMITLTVDPSNKTLLYLDDQFVAQGTGGARFKREKRPIYIGISSTEATYESWRGGIDELKIFDAALSSSEVKKLYLTR